jgi:hypothetical protein
LLAENGITLYSIFEEHHTVSEIANIKYPTGSIIGIDRATKIVNSKKYFQSNSQASNKIKIRILSTIPLISKNTAEKILESISFDKLFTDNIEEELALIDRSEKTKIGQKAAANVISLLRNLKY